MGTSYTPSNIGPGIGSIEQLNNEFQKIYTALDRALSRYPDAPNSMQWPLDMGGQDIINAGNISVTGIDISGQAILDYIDAAIAAAVADLIAQIQGYLTQMQGLVNQAQAYASQALASANDAENSAIASQNSANDSAGYAQDAADQVVLAQQEVTNAAAYASQAEGFKDLAEAAYNNILFLDVVTETSNFVLDDTYTNKMVIVDASGTVTCTIAQGSTVGMQVLVVQAGGGQVSFVSSDNILSKLGFLTDGAGSVASVIRYSPTDVYLNGQLTT